MKKLLFVCLFATQSMASEVELKSLYPWVGLAAGYCVGNVAYNAYLLRKARKWYHADFRGLKYISEYDFIAIPVTAIPRKSIAIPAMLVTLPEEKENKGRTHA